MDIQEQERLGRMQDLWSAQVKGLPKGKFQPAAFSEYDPMQAMQALQGIYGRQVPPEVLLHFLQLGSGIGGMTGKGDDGGVIQALIQSILGAQQGRR